MRYAPISSRLYAISSRLCSTLSSILYATRRHLYPIKSGTLWTISSRLYVILSSMLYATLRNWGRASFGAGGGSLGYR